MSRHSLCISPDIKSEHPSKFHQILPPSQRSTRRHSKHTKITPLHRMSEPRDQHSNSTVDNNSTKQQQPTTSETTMASTITDAIATFDQQFKEVRTPIPIHRSSQTQLTPTTNRPAPATLSPAPSWELFLTSSRPPTLRRTTK